MRGTTQGRVTLHMLFEGELKDKLEKLSRNWHVSFSTVVNIIFEEMQFCVEKVDFIKKSITPDEFQESHMRIICEKKVHLEIKFKYLLFHFQNHFKLRSKAAVVRFILRVYLAKQDRYGFRRVREINERGRRWWVLQKKKQRFWNRLPDHMGGQIEIYTADYRLAGIIQSANSP